MLWRNSYQPYQNLEGQFPCLISDLSTVCFQAFQRPDVDESLICLLYEAHYSHLLQIEVFYSDFAPPFNILQGIKPQIRQIIKRINTLRPQQQTLEFTGEHYATVAKILIWSYSQFFNESWR